MITLLSCGAFSLPKFPGRDNEDAFLLPRLVEDGYVFAIADGVGSYAGAKEAAQTAIKHLAGINQAELLRPEVALHLIKEKISDFSESNHELLKAATTLSYCYLNSENLNVIHVGDTRVYAKKGSKLHLLTKDHTQHQGLLDEGLYTKKELETLPGKNTLTSALSKPLPVRYQYLTIPTSELIDENGFITLFIMSDGAHEFWERRPRFSHNTLSKVNNFSASLFKRIQKAGATDDHSLVAVRFQI